MKTLFITLISLTISLLLAASASLRAQAIKGSGHIIRKEIAVSSFEKLHNHSSADVYLVAEGSGIVIEADDNIIPYIEVANEKGKLTIRNLKNSWFNSKNGIKVTVPIKTLNEIANNGSGNLLAETTINSSDLVIENSGSGNARLPIQAQNLHMTQTGSGNVSLSGKAESITITLRGSGNLNATACSSKTAHVKVSGSGNADIQCTDSLTATVTGSGNITYKGSPNVVKSVSGSGNVQSKGK